MLTSHNDNHSHADSETIPDVIRDQVNQADLQKLGDPDLDILEHAEVALDLIKQVKAHNQSIGLVPREEDTDAANDTKPTADPYRQLERKNDHERELERIREKWNGDLDPHTCSYAEWEDFHGFKDGENYPLTPETNTGILYLLEQTAAHMKSGQGLDTAHVGLLLHLIKATAISDPRIPPWAGYWTHGPVDEIECAELLGYDLDFMNDKVQEIFPGLTIVDDSMNRAPSEPTLLHGKWAEERTNGHAVLELAWSQTEQVSTAPQPQPEPQHTPGDDWELDHEGQEAWYKAQGLSDEDSVDLSPETLKAMVSYFRRAADAIENTHLSTITEIAVVAWGIRALIVADPKIPNEAWKWTAGPLLEYDDSILLGCIPDETVQRIWSTLSEELRFKRTESEPRPCSNESRKQDFEEYRQNGDSLRQCCR
jgi:hypothetical protein